MRFPADAGLLVTAEGGVGRVEVVAVGPDPAGLDAAPHAVGDVHVAAPDARAQSVEGVVGDGQGVRRVLERGHRQHRPEDFLLEEAHFVMALEHGRLHVVAVAQFPAQFGPLSAGQAFRAFLTADIQVAEDFFQLFGGSLSADHGVGVERMALLDRFHSLDGSLDEAVVAGFLDQRPRGTGADFALIQGEHGEAFQGFVEEVVVLGADVGEEDVGRFAAQFQRDRDEVLRGVLHDQPPGGGFAGEGDFGDALVAGQRLAGFQAEAVDDVDDAGRE